MTDLRKEPLVHISKRQNISSAKAWSVRLIAIAIALVVCGIVALVLINNMGFSQLGLFYSCFIKGTFSSSRKIWKFFKNLAVLLSISLAVTPAFRMRFWNIGAEGQTLVGVLGAIAVDFYLEGKVPEPVLLILMLLGALLMGAIWAVIPALFKAKWNTNETLSTLMMNYIATQLVAFYTIVWEVPKGSGKIGIINQNSNVGWLPQLFGSKYLLSIVVAVLVTAFMYVYLNFTRHGYEVAVVGESENTARYVGIKVPKVIKVAV